MKISNLKILMIAVFLHSVLNVYSQKAKNREHTSIDDRTYWVDLLYKMAEPVLANMSKGELRKNMPVEYSPSWAGGNNSERSNDVLYLETFSRLMVGIAPWLDLPDDNTEEGIKRKQIREWALLSYANAVDPDNPDCLLWEGPRQILVDAAFLAESFIRAPKSLWDPLDVVTKQRYIQKFQNLRKVTPFYNNWLLFRGIIEAFLVSIGEEHDGLALHIAVQKINEWYLGDGWYGDGPEFAFDYYNGFVIQPMLLEIIEIMNNNGIESPVRFDLALRRMQRYNQLMERLISPEGSFPAVGRSMTYRMGVFQTLALSAWKYGLPDKMTNGQLRNALTCVMKRMFSVEGNFGKDGFLQLGFVGHQPEMSDNYTNNGSVYLTSVVFLPLGLPADHAFWTAPAEEWTSLKAWSGKPFLKDYKVSIMQ